MVDILVIWSNWMLWSDFIKYVDFKNISCIGVDKNDLNIVVEQNLEDKILKINPKIILNLSAYTNVDESEDNWIVDNYQVNWIWVWRLAEISYKNNIDFISLSTDYVFDWISKNWYKENDIPNPINEYWKAKFLWEYLAKKLNKNSIIIRTSWLFWWGKNSKNFVNTIIRISNELDQLNVVDDQFWSPTYTIDLCEAIVVLIKDIKYYRWEILHFTNTTNWYWISWFEFAKDILRNLWINKKILNIKSSQFKRKANRPKYSKLLNNSKIKLREWREWLQEYIKKNI